MSLESGRPAGAGILVANLDADHDFETTLGLTRAGPPKRPSPRALARAAELGRLLAVLMNPDDRMIGIGADIDVDVATLPGESDPAGPRPNARVLAWAETSATAGLRAAIRRANGDRPPLAHRATGHAVVDALWSIEPPDALTAARCNHRGFGLQLARGLGEALPGAAIVRSRGEVAALVERGGTSRRAAASVGATSCVVKAVCSSAGRDRVWVPLDGSGGADGAIDGQLDRLFERHGEGVIEPWLDRTDDFGAVGYVDDSGRVHLVGLHRMWVDGRGRFRGVDVPTAEGRDGGADGVADGGAVVRLPVGLLPGEASRLRAVHRAVGVALAGAGYRGAFGIDAFRWRDADARIRLHALGEVNARVTMGLLGHIAAHRLARTPSEGRTPLPQQPQPVDDHEQARADIGEDRHP